MKLSKEAIDELQSIYKDDLGIALSFEEAAKEAETLMTLYCLSQNQNPFDAN